MNKIKYTLAALTLIPLSGCVAIPVIPIETWSLSTHGAQTFKTADGKRCWIAHGVISCGWGQNNVEVHH